MNNDQQAMISCENLCKQYDDGATTIDVLQNVNLKVMPAQLIAIIGNSGSGKSTLLHLLGGLDKPTKGTVHINGVNIAAESEASRCEIRNRQLGFVYQFHHLLPEFTALENVCMPLLIGKQTLKQAEEKAKDLLATVGLANRIQHKIGELSGGERQRVAIARALIADPLCVLADEPTGNLDPRNAEKVFELFIHLQEKFKTSVIMVTHDQSIANKSQITYQIEEGRLVMSSSS